MRAHPDKAEQNGLAVEEATELMKRLNDAKDLLMQEIMDE